MKNLINKCIVSIGYGMTRTGIVCTLFMIIIIPVAMLTGDKTHPALVAAMAAALITYALVYHLRDAKRYAQIWRSLPMKDFVICQESARGIKRKKGLNQCPKSLFRSELYNIMGNIRNGDTYRTVTHQGIIETMKKSPAAKAGKIDVTVNEKATYEDSVQKYEKAIYDEKICSECPNLSCRIKKAHNEYDKAKREKFYGVTIKRTS